MSPPVIKIETQISRHMLTWGPACSKGSGVRPKKNFWAVMVHIEMNEAHMRYTTEYPDHQ